MTAHNHSHYACRDHGSSFDTISVFGAITPLLGAIDAFGAAEVVMGTRGASACCRWARAQPEGWQLLGFGLGAGVGLGEGMGAVNLPLN
jgi:hypothetical protein